MPYRNAHWWIVALFPLIAVAFWPQYLGSFGSAPFGLHAHGITTAAWLALLALQSWSIHTRRVAWHRAAGLATFVVLPLFAAAGPLALQGMVALFAGRVDPFHAAYGARLAVADMIAGPAVVVLVVYAFAQRRRMRAHAAAMLATGLLVLPPVLGRLFPMLPGFPADGALGMTDFELSFQTAELVTLVAAAKLATADRAARAPFGFAALVTLAQMLAFATFSRSEAWERMVVRLLDVPIAALSGAAGLVAFGLLWWAWRRVPRRGAAATGTGAPIAA